MTLWRKSQQKPILSRKCKWIFLNDTGYKQNNWRRWLIKRQKLSQLEIEAKQDPRQGLWVRAPLVKFGVVTQQVKPPPSILASQVSAGSSPGRAAAGDPDVCPSGFVIIWGLSQRIEDLFLCFFLCSLTFK